MTTDPPTALATPAPIPEIQLLPVPEPEPAEADTAAEQAAGEGGGGVKVTRLVRSHAIRDSASPPPPPAIMSEGGSVQSERSTGSEVGDAGETGPGGDAVSCTDSGRGDTDTPDGEVYTDNTGTDLTQFIITTLNKNTKDRVLMLKLEQEMSNLVKDSKKTHHKFPHMSSYHRMMVHRVAAFFGLDHNVDQSGNCVIVNTTKNTRLPEMRFKDHIVEEAVTSQPGAGDQPLPMKLKLMKRESCSCDSGDRLSDSNSRRSKSIEEREEEYEKAKRRIFNDMNKEHKSGQETKHHNDQRLHCLASTKTGNQARSFDIRESLTGPADRPAVSKSFSFGGYPQPQHLEPRKQGAGAGAGAASPHYPRPSPPAIVKGQVVWAVSDVSQVPAGSVLINPDNGTPYLNSDGSVYMFDPSNPPRLEAQQAASYPPAPPAAELGLPGGAAEQLSKLALDADQVSVSSQHSSTGLPSTAPPHLVAPPWVVPRLAPAVSHAAHPPYILVNPVSNLPIPHYLPYLSQHPAPAPAPAAAPPLPSHSPVGAGGAGVARAAPLVFSLHRSGSGQLMLYLQHCPSLLTRAQLTSFLDSFLGPAAPQLHGGQWQFLDGAGAWCALDTLPLEQPATNRFPIQIYFESEEMAAVTVAALRQVGFLHLEPHMEPHLQ